MIAIKLYLSLFIIIFSNVSNRCQGFNVKTSTTKKSNCLAATDKKENLDTMEENEKKMNPLTKSSWYAVELFGNLFGSMGQKEAEEAEDYTGPPKSLQETLNRIKMDNDRSYFLSGMVDEEIYDSDCVFSDPFVSFSGRERFVTNLANLGSFITNYSAKVLDYSTIDDTVVQTKIMVKLELNLPWKPILAWPWGVKYTIDPETCLIVDHEESWDIEAWEGVKQIFRKPTLTI